MASSAVVALGKGVKAMGNGGPPVTRPGFTRLANLAASRPVLVVALIAAAIRGVVVVALGTLQRRTLPDENVYLFVARYASTTPKSKQRWSGTAENVYNTTEAFVRPLEWFARIFGPSRFPGQIFAAVLGVIGAAAVAAFAKRISGSGAALFAGLVVALLPSQVLFSSVVMRESEVWAAVAVLALSFWLAFEATTPKRRLAYIALSTFALWVLLLTRVQIGVAVIGALIISGVTLGALRWRNTERSPRWLGVVFIAIAVLTPIATGNGVAGNRAISTGSGRLAMSRQYLSFNAESAIQASKTIRPTTKPTEPGTENQGQATSPTTTVLLEFTKWETVPCPGDETQVCIKDREGVLHVADNSTSANLRHLPAGLVAMLVRPLPFERGLSRTAQASALENVAWFALYALAVVGLWRSRRRLQPLLFPVFAVGAILGLEALTQGNVGTAFRHRGQILGMVALMASLVVGPWIDDRLRRITQTHHAGILD